MTLHDYSIQSKQHTAIVLSRIDALLERRKSPTGKKRAKPRHERTREGKLEIGRKLVGGSLRRLERDISCEPLGHDDVDGSPANVVPLDESRILQRQRNLAQDTPGLPHLFDTL